MERWAQAKPDAVYLAQRDGDGWRTITWAETRRRVRALATALLEHDLSPARPLAILSGNSIEHALLSLAAQYAGLPVAPVSAAYSLMSKDFGKLKTVFELLTPGLVFVDDAEPFAPALAVGACQVLCLFAARNFEVLPGGWRVWVELLEREDTAAVDRAFQSVTPDTIAKFLLTSGSTGEPKAVINTQRMLCSNQQTLAQAWPFLLEEPPVLVDWLPWNHTFGGNNNFGLVLTHGGTFYIDEGKPAPGLIGRTLRNLREISPTIAYNAPRGYDMLLPYLENDPALRRSFFARLK